MQSHSHALMALLKSYSAGLLSSETFLSALRSESDSTSITERELALLGYVAVHACEPNALEPIDLRIALNLAYYSIDPETGKAQFDKETYPLLCGLVLAGLRASDPKVQSNAIETLVLLSNNLTGFELTQEMMCALAELLNCKNEMVRSSAVLAAIELSEEARRKGVVLRMPDRFDSVELEDTYRLLLTHIERRGSFRNAKPLLECTYNSEIAPEFAEGIERALNTSNSVFPIVMQPEKFSFKARQEALLNMVFAIRKVMTPACDKRAFLNFRQRTVCLH